MNTFEVYELLFSSTSSQVNYEHLIRCVLKGCKLCTSKSESAELLTAHPRRP